MDTNRRAATTKIVQKLTACDMCGVYFLFFWHSHIMFIIPIYTIHTISIVFYAFIDYWATLICIPGYSDI